MFGAFFLLLFAGVGFDEIGRRQDGAEGGAKLVRGHRNEAGLEFAQFFFFFVSAAQFLFAVAQGGFDGSAFLNFVFEFFVDVEQLVHRAGQFLGALIYALFQFGIQADDAVFGGTLLRNVHAGTDGCANGAGIVINGGIAPGNETPIAVARDDIAFVIVENGHFAVHHAPENTAGFIL